MARIQKKKPAFKKKKKKEDIPGAQVVTGQSEAAEAKTYVRDIKDIKDSTADADKERKKKKTLSAIQSRTDQTVLLKLADKYFGSWIQFFREVWIELSKVTWPTRKQTIGSTIVVIIFVFMVAVFLGAVDFGLSNIIRLIL